MILISLQHITPWTGNKTDAASLLIGNISSYAQDNVTNFTVSSIYTLHFKQYTSHISWILDSGATDYITCHYHILENHRPMNFIIYLPDGNLATITHNYIVHLPNNIMLSQVLCVPTSRCNLISIPKLTTQ